MQSSPLELQFSVERLKRFLHNNPDQAARLAISYFEDFSVLAIEHKGVAEKKSFQNQDNHDKYQQTISYLGTLIICYSLNTWNKTFKPFKLN